MATTSFLLDPIGLDAANRLRRGGGPVFVADEHPGYPCRQCLRDAQIGERLVLVSHDPFSTESKYRSASPIFVHEQDCGRPESLCDLPTELTIRQLSVRAFDGDEMMIDAAVIQGSALAGTIDAFLSNPATDRIHVHNATRGCWAVNVVRG